MTLRRAVLLVLGLVVTLSLIPVSLVVQRQVHDALDGRMRDDLSRAPRILADRWEAISAVRMMHARDLSIAAGLSDAVLRGDTAAAGRILTAEAMAFPESPTLIDRDGRTVLGAARAPMELVEETREGGMPVSLVAAGDGLHLLALAPVREDGRWLGAAGAFTPMDDGEAQTLAGLTRTGVLILTPDGGASASSLSDTHTGLLTPVLFDLMRADTVSSVRVSEGEFLTTSGPLPGGAKVFFLRNVEEEMAVVPAIQRSILLASGTALALALLLGAFLSSAVTRPVASLANAADRFQSGDESAPLPEGGITEVRRLSGAFRDMRRRLAARLRDLEAANTELAHRQARLADLQGELVQRERSAATGQLVSQLAHEIRNPIASIRNSLEVILRDVEGQGRPEEFTRLAIEELLRMHELAEQMLSMNRPKGDQLPEADPVRVAHEVARLVSLGDGARGVSVVGEEGTRAAISRDGFKQVLLNLVLNAREASGDGPVEVLVTARGTASSNGAGEASGAGATGGAGGVTVQVLDRGDGIPEELLGRIFDPFFTTKSEVQGVGLGLFLAEAIVRRHGGSIRAANRADGPGAVFSMELPGVPA